MRQRGHGAKIGVDPGFSAGDTQGVPKPTREKD